jgi:hypothetical protein
LHGGAGAQVRGRYYGKAACKTALTDIRSDTEALRHGGGPGAMPDSSGARGGDPKQAANWDVTGRQLAVILPARCSASHEAGLLRIKAKVLYILCRTDALFPPNRAR